MQKTGLLDEKPMTLECGPTEFGGIGPSWGDGDRALIMGWFAETAVSNIVWIRVLILRLGWPPISWFQSFSAVEEP